MTSGTFPTVMSATTAQIDSPSRLSYWDRYSAEKLVGLRTSSSLPADFYARLAGCALEELKVFEIEGSVHCVERNQSFVEEFPKSSIFSCQLVSGSAYFVQGGKVTQLTAGETIIYDARKPFTYGFPTPMRQFLVDLPSDLAEKSWGVDIDCLPYKITPKKRIDEALHSELFRSLSDLLRTPPTDSLSSFVEKTNFLLKSIINSQTKPEHDIHPSIFYLIEAKRFIIDNLFDPDLDCSQVAQRVGVSTRHLNRLFCADGCSAAEYIWEKRAEKARRNLVDPSMAHLSISEIAFRCGYSSSAHFSRAIAERYGAPPTAIRRELLRR
jgi:AraC-like DNA-binding protein